MKTCWRLLVIQEIKIKIIVIFQHTPKRMEIQKNQQIENIGNAMGKKFSLLLVGMWIDTTIVKINMESPEKIKLNVPFGTVFLLCTFLKELKASYHSDICLSL